MFENNQFVLGVLTVLTELSNKSGRHSFASRICFHNLRFKALYTILTYITAAQTDHEMCGQSVQHYGLHHHFNSRVQAGIEREREARGFFTNGWIHRRHQQQYSSPTKFWSLSFNEETLAQLHGQRAVPVDVCFSTPSGVSVGLETRPGYYYISSTYIVLPISTFGKRWAKWVCKTRLRI